MSTEHLISNPTCPRCRYDLSGATASWSESCPCAGRCPECGFDFDWANLLRSDRQRDERFIEHTRRRRRIPVAAIRTLARSLYPPGFWSWIKLHHETSVRRMILWLALLVVPLWATQALLSNAELFASEYAWHARFGGSHFGYSHHAHNQPPFSHYSIYLSAWTQPFMTLDDWSYAFGNWEWIAADLVPGVLVSLIALQATWPLMVAILRTTLGKAKVHWKHLLRAFVYSVGWMVLLLLAVVVIRGANLFGVLTSPNTTWGLDSEIIEVLNNSRLFFALTLGFMAWTVWWWYIVIVRHWQLQRGRLIWTVLCVPASLMAFIGALTHQIWLAI